MNSLDDFRFSLRQVDAFFDHIKKQLENPIQRLYGPSDLITLDAKKRYIVGHFDSDQSNNYKTFEKVANLLRDECHFAVSTNKYVHFVSLSLLFFPHRLRRRRRAQITVFILRYRIDALVACARVFPPEKFFFLGKQIL